MSSLAAALTQQRTSFIRLAQRAQEDADGKTIHKLRILTRQMRASVWIHERAHNSKVSKRLKKELRALGKMLGESRQFHVLIEDAKEFDFKTKRLKKDLRGENEDIKTYLSKKRIKDITDGLKALEKEVKTSPRLDHKMMSTLIKRHQWPRRFPRDPELQHAIRIDTKKMRYRLELLGVEESRLRSLQRSLGRSHDLTLLEDRFHQTPETQKEMKLALKKAEKTYLSLLKKL